MRFAIQKVALVSFFAALAGSCEDDLGACADNISVAYWDSENEKCICKEGYDYAFCEQEEDKQENESTAR